MRSCWPSRYGVSTVSSVRQTIPLVGNPRLPHQPDDSATNFYEFDTQPLPILSWNCAAKPLPRTSLRTFSGW